MIFGGSNGDGEHVRPKPKSANHIRTLTFVAGLRRNKMVAPFVVDGSMNRASFLAYVEQCLKPTLKRGDTVIIDNLPAHKGAEVERLIAAAHAALLYLPKYSTKLWISLPR